jgi:glycosyltransferase involved in cell wall biosynthesis
MSIAPPKKVLIAGGKSAGGVASFAAALRCGFTDLGLQVEVATPSDILRRIGELHNPEVLKILSLAASFAAPVARRTLCIAHGIPCAAYQGWPTALAVLASHRLATACKGTQLVAVSDYTALHLRAIFNLRVDAVIRNPVLPLFTEALPKKRTKRKAITYVGSLHRAKNVHQLVPSMRNVLDENPGMCAWIVGNGPMRGMLEQMVVNDERFKFFGALPPQEVRERLRQTRVLVSGCLHEALGIVYIEALSQGCVVVMPAAGGGLEIAPQLIGSGIQLFPASATSKEIAFALRKALLITPEAMPLTAYSARTVAEAYLTIDSRFSARGEFGTNADL